MIPENSNRIEHPDEESRFVDLLRRAGSGERDAENELLPLIYEELKVMAQALFRHERRGHTLQPTIVVHDALMRLFRAKAISWNDKTQFYRYAARNMRQVLIDYAKYHKSRVPPGQLIWIDDVADLLGTGGPIEVEEIDDVLKTVEEISALSQRQVQGIVLRVYCGLTDHEVAEVIGISETQAKNDWRFARALIRDRLLKTNEK